MFKNKKEWIESKLAEYPYEYEVCSIEYPKDVNESFIWVPSSDGKKSTFHFKTKRARKEFAARIEKKNAA